MRNRGVEYMVGHGILLQCACLSYIHMRQSMRMLKWRRWTLTLTYMQRARYLHVNLTRRPCPCSTPSLSLAVGKPAPTSNGLREESGGGVGCRVHGSGLFRIPGWPWLGRRRLLNNPPFMQGSLLRSTYPFNHSLRSVLVAQWQLWVSSSPCQTQPPGG